MTTNDAKAGRKALPNVLKGATMSKLISTLVFAALALGTTAPAQARIQQAWVSGHGTNTASCGASTSPCRTFQYAIHSILASGGEIDVLDPAEYGPVTINFPLSIVNDQVGAATISQAAAQPAITITVAAAGKVYLRGLTIDGFGTGTHGILFKTGDALDIANCVVRNFSGNGIFLNSSTVSTLSITDTVVSEIANVAIFIFPTGSAGVTGFIKGVTARNNYDGILLDGLASTSAAALDVTVVDSVASGSQLAGFYSASDTNHATTSLALRNVTASNNGTGVRVDGPKGFGYLAHSVIDGNARGTNVQSGVLNTFGDNTYSNNTTKHFGAQPTTVPQE